jgi:hypothetical protein
MFSLQSHLLPVFLVGILCSQEFKGGLTFKNLLIYSNTLIDECGKFKKISIDIENVLDTIEYSLIIYKENITNVGRELKLA